MATKFNALSSLNFWVREKTTATAEMDYSFMDLALHKMALRFYSGKINLTQTVTQTGKTYYLLSLPYYLVSQIERYLVWLQRQVEE